MNRLFEELDYQPTAIGALSLRRRRDPADGAEVYEIKLGDDFLMSSRFTAAEVALAGHGLAAATGERLEVVVGGLGLGYTAFAALQEPRVVSLLVVEALGPVIEWHRQGLLPLGSELVADPRCRFVEADFFARAADPAAGFDPAAPGRRFDAVLLDIDHAPDRLLSPAHAAFYRPEGLALLAEQLKPGGVFALWSNDPPDDDFLARLRTVFGHARTERIGFENLRQDAEVSNSLYLASAKPLEAIS